MLAEAQEREARTAAEASSGRKLFRSSRREEADRRLAAQQAAVDYWRERVEALGERVAGLGVEDVEDRETPPVNGADPSREVTPQLDLGQRAAPEVSDQGPDWDPGW
jgi:hypothetical protein